MSPIFGATVILYALGLAGVCAVAAVSGRPRAAVVTPALVIVELATLVNGALDGLTLIRGPHGDDVATNVGYLLTSIAIVPVTVATVRLDAGRWGSTALVVGLVLVAVVSLRLHQTLGTAHA